MTISINEFIDIINNNTITAPDTCEEFFTYVPIKHVKIHDAYNYDNVYIIVLLISKNAKFNINVSDEYNYSDFRFPGNKLNKKVKTIFISLALETMHQQLITLNQAIND